VRGAARGREVIVGTFERSDVRKCEGWSEGAYFPSNLRANLRTTAPSHLRTSEFEGSGYQRLSNVYPKA